jgi:hypothetical protein
MSENAIDSAKATPEPAAAKPKGKPGKKLKPKKKAGRVVPLRLSPYTKKGTRKFAGTKLGIDEQ